jgi:hypothetical protein
MPRATAILTLCLLPGFLACNSSSNTDTTTDAKTLIAVDSEDFPESAACRRNADGTVAGGAFVGELIDVTGRLTTTTAYINALKDFRVRASQPVACGDSIGFADAVPNRSYEVQVMVYPDTDGDPNTVDICTRDNSNVAVAKDADGNCTTTFVSPSETLRCHGWVDESSSNNGGLGNPNGQPAIAIEFRTVTAHYCIPES